MAIQFTDILRQGQDYMKVWPMQKQLFSLFPDGQIIMATKFAINVMPALAVICAAVLINAYGMTYLPQALTIAIFFLSLPLQGILWLGYRANQPLPPAIRGWYREIHSKMREQGCSVQAAKSQPRYKELAKLLKTAFEELDRVFTKQWF